MSSTYLLIKLDKHKGDDPPQSPYFCVLFYVTVYLKRKVSKIKAQF